VQLGQGQPGAEGDVGQVQMLQLGPGLFQRGALAQDPGDELKGRDVFHPLQEGFVVCAAWEIQPGHTQPLLVGGLIIEGISVRHSGHADEGVMAFQGGQTAKAEREIPRRDGDLLPVGALIVQGSAKVVVLGPVGDCGTHSDGLLCQLCSDAIIPQMHQNMGAKANFMDRRRKKSPGAAPTSRLDKGPGPAL